MMRLVAMPILALALTACDGRRRAGSDECGPPQRSGAPCTVALSGALKGTMTCAPVAAVYKASQDEFIFRLEVESSNPRVGGRVNVTVRSPGAPRVGTYRNTDAGAKSVMYAYSSNYLREWSQAAGGATGPQGNHTLTISKVGVPFCLSDGKAYPGIRGSLHASLPASGSSAASGIVNLRATF
jgi:hypothetical protein